MIKTTITMISAVMIAGLLVSGVYAASITLNDAQMDGVAAGGVTKVDGFICPVIPGKGLAKNYEKYGVDSKFFPIGNGGQGDVIYYSFHGPDVSVPMHATNANGAGSPGGTFAAPGDTGYTAIWRK